MTLIGIGPLHCWRLLLAIGCGTWLGGCATPLRSGATEGRPSPSTGHVLTWLNVQEVFPGITLGSRSYAEVNSEWLRRWYNTYRSELFRLGIVQWNERFDCGHFAGFYASLAQASFYKEMFHSSTPADALALGPVWYHPDNATVGHAIVQALTERGRIFIDPQTGEEVTLSPRELASAFLQYF